jgi:hypothetical protein
MDRGLTRAPPCPGPGARPCAQTAGHPRGGRGPRGWEALWAKDAWRQSDPPHADLALAYRGDLLLRFDGLVQPWVNEAAKRWARMRLLGDTTPSTMRAYLTELRHFSGWLADQAPEVLAPAMLTRAVLEDYMLWVRPHHQEDQRLALTTPDRHPVATGEAARTSPASRTPVRGVPMSKPPPRRASARE